jgi:hypothetical protein
MEKTGIHIRWDRIFMVLFVVCIVWNGIDVHIGGFRIWLNPLRNVIE